ncbi:hypothetical protein [Nocardioides massiliensis]|uniref:Holin n=1 Tax=Nocardioides massiliensis TaxID=1325935 RepID=A0ABT9NJB8_9ACTN|nr:hypothetical protein [Nocardioides massiliensis]MDP9820494.1 hypothetical protein [Nocardioides massiliensis]
MAEKKLTASRRRRIYDVLIAAAPLVGLYVGVTEQELALWLYLAASVLGVGVARQNVTED